MSLQARRIIHKFGSLAALAAAIGRTRATVYRWTYPQTRGGTGGLIPSSAIPLIQAAAERLNIKLTAKDWTP